MLKNLISKRILYLIAAAIWGIPGFIITAKGIKYSTVTEKFIMALYEKLHQDEQNSKVVSNDTVAAVTCTPEQLQQTITLAENNLYTTGEYIQIANASYQGTLNVDLNNDTAI